MKKILQTGLSLLMLFGIVCTSIMANELPKIHRYTSPTGWNVNSYILESNIGVVIIDAQLFRSDARKLSQIANSINKPVAGVIITHPHIDHFAGMTVLRQQLGDFPVYATQATAAELQQVHDNFVFWGAGPYGDEVETVLTPVSHVVESGTTLILAGINLLIDDLGPGEAVDNIVIYQPESKALFTGDVTQPHYHYYIGDGYLTNALQHLKYIKKQYPDVARIYSGHGDPAYLNIVDSNKKYIKRVYRLTEKALSDDDNLDPSGLYLTSEARQAVAQKVLDKYPDLGDFNFSPLIIVMSNVYGIELELARQASETDED